MSATYTLALNNYRAGGGGFLGFKGAPIVYQSSDEIRNLMIQYVKETGSIEPTVDNNWHLVPDYLGSPYQSSLDTLNRQNALGEFPAGGFNADALAVRSDLAAIIAGSYATEGGRNFTSTFTDVPGDSWYARSVGTVQAMQLMFGTSSSTFAPTAPATTEQVVTVLMRANAILRQTCRQLQPSRPIRLAFPAGHGLQLPLQSPRGSLQLTKQHLPSIR